MRTRKQLASGARGARVEPAPRRGRRARCEWRRHGMQRGARPLLDSPAIRAALLS